METTVELPMVSEPKSNTAVNDASTKQQQSNKSWISSKAKCWFLLFIITSIIGIAAIVSLIAVIATSTDQTSSTVDKSPLTACDVFCYGPLLHIVQTARLFNDSKEFVDMPLKRSPEDVVEAFSQLPNYSRQTLLQFLADNFLPAGSDLETITPADFNPKPEKLVKILENSKYLDWSMELNSIWRELVRKPKITDPTRHTLLSWKNPIVVPGGRFRESYYWDSYWIILGLLVCDMKVTATGIVSNFIDIILEHGFIPNGGRAYYLTRSQPPFLAEMISELYAAGAISDAYVKEALVALEKEHDFFMLPDRMVTVKKHKLNRYTGGNDKTPRPESYSEDLETSASSARKGYLANEVLVDLRAGAESGWDYSTRWFRRKGQTLDEINTRKVLPVDLNVILLRYERFLERNFDKFGDTVKAARFKNFADSREAAIEAIFWDESNAMWRDWLIDDAEFSTVLSVSNFLPLWAGLGTTGPRKLRIIDALNASGLVRAGGVATTNIDSGQQWDGDNAWPPLQDLLVDGLMQGGDEEGKTMAIGIVRNWLESNFMAWQNSGGMMEKYLASKPGAGGGGGEYELQLGFGWTNGVALRMLTKFADHID